MRINICFHGIGAGEEREPGGANYWISRELFLGVLDELRGRPDVRISFDDGNSSDIDVGLPALLERGMQATFFPLAGRLEEAASLGPDDLRSLRSAGMGVGTHGWAHVPWRNLSPAEQGLYEQVTEYVRREMNRAERLDGRRGNQVGFALTVLQRRLASSPAAIHRSLERRRLRLEARRQEMLSDHALPPVSAGPVPSVPVEDIMGTLDELVRVNADRFAALVSEWRMAHPARF